jgi:hypothetical protein
MRLAAMSRLLLSLAVVSVFLATGCKRSTPNAKSGGAGQSSLAGAVSPGKTLPTYSFRDERLKQAHPDVAGFVTQFLETCLTGDYMAYRRLVSRFEKPESRERFAAIYVGLDSIVVESIERIESDKLRGLGEMSGGAPEAPASAAGDVASTAPASTNASTGPGGVANARHAGKPIYLVISTVTFNPDAKVKLRARSRSVAILVFEEDGAWRMAPAPAEMQPRDSSGRRHMDTPESESEPIPDYPWAQDGDS